MTTVDPVTGKGKPVKRRISWLNAALIVSLAFNLLFIGGAVARFFTHERVERISGISQMQLIPRRFFGELDRQRRLELLSTFKAFRGEFSDGRKRAKVEMSKLAKVLEMQPYDPAAVKTTVDGFSSVSSDLVKQGSEAALVFIGKLTPEERILLAKHIRLRSEPGHHRKGSPHGGD